MTTINLPERLYKIGHSNLFSQEKCEISIRNLGLKVVFGEKDGKRYVAVAKYNLGRWSYGFNDPYYEVFYRRNFWSREEGNRCFKALLALGPYERYAGTEYTTKYNASLDQILNTLGIRR